MLGEGEAQGVGEEEIEDHGIRAPRLRRRPPRTRGRHRTHLVASILERGGDEAAELRLVLHDEHPRHAPHSAIGSGVGASIAWPRRCIGGTSKGEVGGNAGSDAGFPSPP